VTSWVSFRLGGGRQERTRPARRSRRRPRAGRRQIRVRRRRRCGTRRAHRRGSTGRKLPQQLLVIPAAGELGGSLGGVDAGDDRAQTLRDHVGGEFGGGPTPQREHGGDAGALQGLFSVGADVFEEQVPEDQPLGAGLPRRRRAFSHPLLVDVIGARPGQCNDVQRQTQRIGLSLQQVPAHPVGRHPVGRRGEGGEQAGDLHPPALPWAGAAAPRSPYLLGSCRVKRPRPLPWRPRHHPGVIAPPPGLAGALSEPHVSRSADEMASVTTCSGSGGHQCAGWAAGPAWGSSWPLGQEKRRSVDA